MVSGVVTQKWCTVTRSEIPQTLRNLAADVQHVAGQMQQHPDLDTCYQHHTFSMFRFSIETRKWADDIERLERERMRVLVDAGRQS